MSSFEPAERIPGVAGFVPDPLPSAPPAFRGDAPKGEPEPVRPEPERSDVEPEVRTPAREEERADAAPSGEPAPDLEALRQRAFEEGRTAGRSEAARPAAEEIARALEAVGEAVQALVELRRDYLAEHRRSAVELALAVAEKLVGRAVEADPDALAGLVERALSHAEDDGPVRLWLSAQDRETLRTGGAAALDRLVADRSLEVEVDSELAPGDVRVQAGGAHVDARRLALLQRVREELDVENAEGSS